MKKKLVVFPAVALAFAAIAYTQAPAAAPTKVATIQVQGAILSTIDGKKAQASLTSKFQPESQKREKRQNEIVALQDQLRKGGATMSEEAKNKIMRDIDSGQTALKRMKEDFDADLQQEEGKIMNELGTKMMDVIIKYGTKNGIAMVVDVSNPQTPVLWADPAVDITQEIIKLYDQAHPGDAPAAKPQPASPPKSTVTTPPANPPAGAKPPVTPPAGKKN